MNYETNETLLGHDLTTRMALMNMDDKTLANACLVNSSTNDLCTESFWRDRFAQVFFISENRNEDDEPIENLQINRSDMIKLPNVSWKQYYILFRLLDKDNHKGLAKYVYELNLSGDEINQLYNFFKDILQINLIEFRSHLKRYLILSDNFETTITVFNPSETIPFNSLLDSIKFAFPEFIRKYTNYLSDHRINIQLNELRQSIVWLSDDQIRGYLNSNAGMLERKNFNFILDLIIARKYIIANELLSMLTNDERKEIEDKIVKYTIRRIFYGENLQKQQNLMNFIFLNELPLTYSKIIEEIDNSNSFIDRDLFKIVINLLMQNNYYPTKEETTQLFESIPPISYESLVDLYIKYGLLHLIDEKFYL